MAAQLCEQAVVFAAVHQGHRAVLGQIPEQPGMVVLIDVAVLPDPAVGQRGDQPVTVLQLQHVCSACAVGPGVSAVVGIIEVKVGIEGQIGRRAFILQIQLGQLRMLFGGG